MLPDKKPEGFFKDGIHKFTQSEGKGFYYDRPEWIKDHFVVCIHDARMFPSGLDNFCNYALAVDHQGRPHLGYSTTAAPVIFETRDDAIDMIKDFMNDIKAMEWVGMEFDWDNPLKTIRDLGDNHSIDPFFSIENAFEYRTFGLKEILRKHESEKEARRNHHGKFKLPHIKTTVIRTSDAQVAPVRERSHKMLPPEPPRFYIFRDTVTGKYVHIPNSGINGAYLTKRDDSTYFDNFDTALKVASHFENSYWNPSWSRWRLAIIGVFIKDDKIVGICPGADASALINRNQR